MNFVTPIEKLIVTRVKLSTILNGSRWETRLQTSWSMVLCCKLFWTNHMPLNMVHLAHQGLNIYSIGEDELIGESNLVALHWLLKSISTMSVWKILIILIMSLYYWWPKTHCLLTEMSKLLINTVCGSWRLNGINCVLDATQTHVVVVALEMERFTSSAWISSYRWRCTFPRQVPRKE